VAATGQMRGGHGARVGVKQVGLQCKLGMTCRGEGGSRSAERGLIWLWRSRVTGTQEERRRGRDGSLRARGGDFRKKGVSARTRMLYWD